MSNRRRLLGNWLTEYVRFNEISEAPPAFHFWVGVSTIAGALRRRVWNDQRVFQWTPNFYIVLVAPPGVVTKSTAIRIGTSMLKEIEGIHFGPASMTWHALTEALMEAKELMPAPGEDPTSLEAEFIPMSCITCNVNELGTFLDPSDQKLVDVLTDLWDSQLGVWEHRTKTQGKTFIENPWVNVISATTPAWIEQNIPEYLIGGGLTSRIIFVYAQKKNKLIPFPAQMRQSTEYRNKREELIHDLSLIAELNGEYHMTPDAVRWGEEQYERIWEHDRPRHLMNARYDGYLARKQTHTLKTAMVIAAAQRDELLITEDDLIMADKALTFAEYDMVRVFESIGSSEENKNVTMMLKHIKQHGGKISKVKLLRYCLNNMSMKSFKEAMDSCVASGYVKLFGKSAKDENSLEQYVHLTEEGREKLG